jgi:hypothetical protein
MVAFVDYKLLAIHDDDSNQIARERLDRVGDLFRVALPHHREKIERAFTV